MSGATRRTLAQVINEAANGTFKFANLKDLRPEDASKVRDALGSVRTHGDDNVRRPRGCHEERAGDEQLEADSVLHGRIAPQRRWPPVDGRASWIRKAQERS